MPGTPYPGDPSTFSRAVAHAIQQVIDADPQAAATYYAADRKNADAIEWMRQHAAIFDDNNTFTLLNTFTQQATLNGGWQNTHTPTHLYARLWNGSQGARVTRGYSGNGIKFETVNAAWDDVAQTWAPDDTGIASTFIAQTTGSLTMLYRAAGAGPWTQTVGAGGWDSSPAQFDLIVGSLSLANFLAVTLGDITATAGNIVAAGDPDLNKGRLKGKQIISTTGGAPVGTMTSEVGCDNTVGDGGGSVQGTDVCGTIQVDTGAATGNGVICRVTFDKAYPAGPVVILGAASQAASDLGWQPFVTSAPGYFEVNSGGGAKKLVVGTHYVWRYTAIGL